MTLLVIQLAARPNAWSEVGAAATPGANLVTFQHVLSVDGIAVGQVARANAAALPRADSVVAVLPASDVAWHRATLPKAPPARMRQALAGMLEEQLLDEPEDSHLAIAPQARAGDLGWIAATHRGWLTRQLAILEEAGVIVDRVVPACAPSERQSERPTGHFSVRSAQGDVGATGGTTDSLWLSWSDFRGALCLPTAGGLARSMVPPGASAAVWSATPAAAATAERWLGAPVSVRSEAEQALTAARSGWNLRQFELAAHARGLRALRGMGRKMLGDHWRPLRWGMAALVLVHVLGLNLWAWLQQRGIDERRAELTAVLRASHPQVRSILDAPLQMQRETELLRAAAGRAGPEAFESMLALAAAAWPDARPPLERLKYEPGRLVVPAAGWMPAQIQQLRGKLEAAGGKLDASDTELSIARAPRKAKS